MYPSIPASPDFPQIERGILAFWKKDDTFRASVEQRDGSEEWVFYDGPPFANGLPHYGHLLTGYAKDLFPRFQTMRGKQVVRRFGWDTHGLPAELEAMRQLGITQKHEIEEMGIAAFNAKARESVLRYTKEWEDYVTRQARWVDFENDYKTLDVTFMESVIWAFKQLYQKGLAYEGFRVLPYCWNDETPAVEPRTAHGRRRLQDAAGPVGHGHVPARGREGRGPGSDRRRGSRLDDDAMDPADEPRARGRPRHPVLGRAGGAAHRDVRHPQVPARDRHDRRATSRSSATRRAEDAVAASTRTVTGAELDGVHYDRLWDYYAEESWGTGQRLADPRRRLRRDRRGHRHRAPGARLRRRRPGELLRRPASRRSCRSTTAGGSCRRFRTSPGSTGSRRTSRSPHPSKSWADSSSRSRTSTATRTAGGAATRSSTRPCRAGSCVCPTSATGWASSTSRSPGFPRTSSTASSASGCRTRATGRSAATATGARRSRCGRATTPPTRGSTCTDRWPRSRPTSARCRWTPTATPTSTARSSTS